MSFTGLSDGAADLTMNFNLYGSTGSSLVTQTAGTSKHQQTPIRTDSPAGAYQGFTVDGTGNDHGDLRQQPHDGHWDRLRWQRWRIRLGWCGMAATIFTVTAASGRSRSAPRVRVDGRRLWTTSWRVSNVDISQEFSNLIVAQRAFEANSKTVTTFDTVTQDAISMIR